MTDVLDAVRDHYRATGLTERLKMVLAALGAEDQRLTPQQLAALDQFHTRGLAATADLAKLAGITADMSVLDVGSGVGGPARFLTATYGCQVTGVDLSEAFIDANIRGATVPRKGIVVTAGRQDQGQHRAQTDARHEKGNGSSRIISRVHGNSFT